MIGAALVLFTLVPSARARPNNHDIAVIIDNRSISDRAEAKEDVDALAAMFEINMLVEHVIRLERPSYDIICDIFGGCPEDARNPWPPLIAQITERNESRLYVHYIGPGLIEGRQRQLLFAAGSEDGRSERPRQYAVGWLHYQLIDARPRSSLVLLESGFGTRPSPCAGESPELPGGMASRDDPVYARLMAGRGLPAGAAELSATLPVQVAHCDRYDLTLRDEFRPLFTKFLLEGIVEGRADGDDDGMITLGEIASYIDDRTGRAARFQWGRRQQVWLVGSKSRTIARVAPSNDAAASNNDARGKNDAERGSRAREDDPAAAASHSCTLDPQSADCRLSCRDDRHQDACPFEATVGKVRWLQSALTVMNHNPGPIDGVIGPRTRKAIASWRDQRDVAGTGVFTEGEFKRIVEEFGRLFEQVPARSDRTAPDGSATD